MANEYYIEDILAKAPLYRKFEIDDSFFHPIKWHGLKFQFDCDIENGERTFMVELEPAGFIHQSALDNEYFENKEQTLNYILHVSGVCQSCGRFKAHFLLNVFSDSPIKPFVHRDKERAYLINLDGIQDQNYNPKFFIRKVGQLPAFSIKPDKEIENFLEEKDKEYYSKALICLSQSFGIGAYSYFRRIVETEIIRIVEYLINLNLPQKGELEAAYQTYKSNHQMDSFLAKIDNHLPIELNAIHEKPLRLLYSELSLGIHSYEEEVCLRNAETANTLLTFIIKALNIKKKNKEFADQLKNLGR